MSLYIILFILWLCFWSFSTVLISRWRSWKWWIMMGRSECPHCNHTLTAFELIPLLSWLFQWGRCKSCKTPIPIYYPVSEVVMWSIFVLMGLISSNLGYPIISVFTTTLLFYWFVTTIYVIYDIRYMEIPDQILIPGIIVTLVLLYVWYLGEEYRLFFDYYSYESFHTFLTDHLLAAIFIYSFFFLQILIPASVYLVRKNRYSDLFWLFLSYFTFPVVIIMDYFRWKSDDDTNEDIPVWIWGWDLRIALFIGLTLGTLHSVTTLIFAYILWSIVGILLLTYWKIAKRKPSHMIAFGPFLWAGWFLSLIFHNQIIQYLQILNL